MNTTQPYVVLSERKGRWHTAEIIPERGHYRQASALTWRGLQRRIARTIVQMERGSRA